MAGGIFISYRRDDAKHAAGRLVDKLEQTYAREQLFFDIDNIAPGLDFVKELSDQVQACDVLLAVIGPSWIDAHNSDGSRRLDSPRDFVRIEIEAALARDIRVVPVLVDGAPMPREDDLPEKLKPLTRRNAVRLTHERFSADAEGLAEALAKAVVPRKKEKSGIGPFGWSAPLAKPSAPIGRTATWSRSAQPLPANGAPAAQSMTNWWSVFIAVILAALPLPLGLRTHIWVQEKMWEISSNELNVISLITAFIILIAVAIVRRRGAALTRAEAVLYWLGVSLACVVWMATFFSFFRWSFWTFHDVRDSGFSGALLCLFLAMIGGLALRRRWMRQRAKI